MQAEQNEERELYETKEEKRNKRRKMADHVNEMGFRNGKTGEIREAGQIYRKRFLTDTMENTMSTSDLVTLSVCDKENIECMYGRCDSLWSWILPQKITLFHGVNWSLC